MSKTEKKVDVSDFTDAQLEAALAKRKAEKRELQEKERTSYEAQRNQFVARMVERALELERIIGQFKNECHAGMEEQEAKLQAYGKMPSKSKGGFSLTDTDGILRITRTRNTEPRWDERSLKGVEILEQFLADTIKKRSKKAYHMLMKFMKRNENGHLEYNKVMLLLQEENLYDDAEWVEGLRLIKEGYSNHLKAYGYELKTRTAEDGWSTIPLNFSSI